MRDTFITDWPVSERFPHYTRANAGEVMAEPVTPLGWTFCWDGAAVLGFRDGWIAGGTHEWEDFDHDHPESIGMFGGYFYINLSVVRLQGVRNPGVTVEQLDTAFFGDHPEVPPYVPHPDDDKPHLVPNIEAHMGRVMTATEWPILDEQQQQARDLRASRGDLTLRTDAELVARARSTRRMMHDMFTQHVVVGSASAIAPGIFAAVGQAIGDPTIPMKLLAAIGDVDSALPSHALWDLSRRVRASEHLTALFDEGVERLLVRLLADESPEAAAFLAEWDRFIEEFGSRGPNEWDIGAHSWETDQRLPLAALDRIRHQADDESPDARHSAVAAQREALTEEVRASVADDEELAGMVDGALVAGKMMAFRERAKTTIIRVFHENRMVFRELGRRHAGGGQLDDAEHVFMLLESELDLFVDDPAAFRETLAERAADYRELWELEPPFFIRDGVVPPLSTWPRRVDQELTAASAGEELQGVSGSPGNVRGVARVILDPGEPDRLEPGDILVAPSTDPSWTPLFLTAGGVVVDVGGQISHAVIVSRELGLPCAISVTDATRRIPDGAEISVDGDTGAVTVLSVP